MSDDRGQQVEAGDPVVLPFPGSVSQFAALVEVDHEQGAFDTADFPQGRRQLVLARVRGELAQELAPPTPARSARPWPRSSRPDGR